MPEKEIENEAGEAHASNGRVNRRRFVKGLAVAGGVTAFGSISASAEAPDLGTKAVSQKKAENVFTAHASQVIDTLADEGVLSEASLNELPMSQTTTNPREVGVTHEVGGDEEVYAARRRTDQGSLAVLVRPETGDAIGVLKTEDGYTVYDEDGVTPNDPWCTGCQQTDACPTPIGIPDNPAIFCFGTFVSCCG